MSGTEFILDTNVVVGLLKNAQAAVDLAQRHGLGDLRLTHFKVKTKDQLDGVHSTRVVAGEESPLLRPITDNGLREARDREKTYLSDLIRRLNEALGKEVSDTDQVALAVHVTEKLRTDAVVMAQVMNNPKDQALRANLPGAMVQALVEAMTTHTAMSQKLLGDERSRGVFLDVVYELLKRGTADGMFGAGAA